MTRQFLLMIILNSILFAQLCLHSEALAGRILSKRQNDRDFAPRLTHQPHSVTVQPNAPHTSECPVESQPDSDVKWFKDNRLLVNEAMHLEQTGSELMFVQINDNDTGDYHCEATNYLGKVTSEPFRLTVQTSQLDENMQLEPSIQVAGELQEQAVEFKCTLPISSTSTSRRSRVPEVVSWRKNGRRLQQVVWLSEGDVTSSSSLTSSSAAADQQQQNHGRYFARRGERQNEFILSIVRLTRARDDNSTFTCLYNNNNNSDGLADESSLAHESRPALLRVEQQQQPVKLNIPMGPPMVELNSSTYNNNNVNQTTQLSASDGQQVTTNQTNQTTTTQRQRIRTTLSETLADLYEIAKPTLMIFTVMCLVLLIVLLQFLLIRRRTQASHRYTKHHHQHQHHQLQYSSASSSSANSGAGLDGSATLNYCNATNNHTATHLNVDPLLSSLLSRTLSGNTNTNTSGGAPTSASSLSVNGISCGVGGVGGKKFKSYRDHMRKVAATMTNDSQLVEGMDFIDASAFFKQQQQQQLFTSGSSAAAVPNLYDQSLAAREQARSLLMYHQQQHQLNNNQHSDASTMAEHMRSLGNLAQVTKQRGDQNHHLELPQNFSTTGPLETGAANLLQAFQAQSNAWALAAQQQEQQQQPKVANGEQHYQLMNCSASSVSPSSSSSIVATSGGGSSTQGSNSSTAQQQQQDCDIINSKRRGIGGKTTNVMPIRESVSDYSNHYSTIETDDQQVRTGANQQQQQQLLDEDLGEQDDDQYEELIERSRGAFVRHEQSRTTARSSMESSRSTQSSSSSSSRDLNHTLNQCVNSRRQHSTRLTAAAHATADQLSPYAVSSICTIGPASRQVTSQAPPPPAPQAVTSEEAMRALNEQFDINKLVLVDNNQEVGAASRHLPFNLPPPPPPPRNH